MGKFEKVKDETGEVKSARFGKRIRPEIDPATGQLINNPTVASYPLLNPRALAQTIGNVRQLTEERARVQGEKQKPKDQRDPQRLKMQVENMSSRLDQQEFEQLLSTENFSKLYAQNLIELPEYSPEQVQETRGAWATFPQDADPMTYRPAFVFEGEEHTGEPLVPSIENYPLEWCTADPDTARTQLEGGDFHVYYSVNEYGKPTIPRLAIRMEGTRIAEPPRGIAPDQNLDSYIAPVLEEKLKEFGKEGEVYKKRVADMQKFTAIENKTKFGEDLTKAELTFLYEIEDTIEGFGYARDPRIEELRSQRNPHEDAPTVLDCAPSQIAWNRQEVNENTKAYIGPLYPEIFTRHKHLDHIYTSFPEGRIRRGSVAIGTIPKEDIDLVCLTVADLGFVSYATTDEIYQRCQELGLD